MTFRALRNISLDPWRIGDIVAAALAICTPTTAEQRDNTQ
jgi:hypothetical protein